MTAKLKTAINKEENPQRKAVLERNIQGADGVKHLIKKVDEKKQKRLQLTDEVAKIGAKNKLEADKAGREARAKAERAKAKEAAARAREAEANAKAMQEEVAEANELDRLKAIVAQIPASDLKKAEKAAGV